LPAITPPLLWDENGFNEKGEILLNSNKSTEIVFSKATIDTINNNSKKAFKINKDVLLFLKDADK
jgi:hypothetical protein